MGAATPVIIGAIQGFAASVLLGPVLRSIFGRDDPDPVKASIRPTLAERGSQIPLLIGRDELAPVVIMESDREVRIERNSTAGGKGVGSGGSGLDNEVVFCKMAMALCVGPATRLRRITYNGEQVWPIESAFPNGIEPHTSPSGSSFETGGEAELGPFEIYWGEADQPLNVEMTRPDIDRFPVETRLPYVCYLYWPDLRLGGQGTLGQMQIDMEARPFQEAVTYATNSAGTSYEDVITSVGTELGGTSAPWFRNGKRVDEANCNDALLYDTAADTVKVEGDFTTEYQAGKFIALEYPGLFTKYGVSLGATYNASEVINGPDVGTLTDRLTSSDINADWTKSSMSASSVTVFPPGVSPLGGNAQSWQLQIINPAQTGYVEVSPDPTGFVPPGADPTQGSDCGGPGYNRFTAYILNEGQDSALELQVGSDFSNASKHGVIRVELDNFVTAYTGISPNTGTFGSVTRVGSSNWYKLEITQETGGSQNSIGANETLKLRVYYETFAGGLSNPRIKVCLVGNTFAGQAGAPILQFSSDAIVTGVTTVTTPFDLTGLNAFTGELCPYVDDPNGEAGANAAHILYQLLFEEDPHGLGLDPDYWDLSSLQDIGDELETEGVRTHLILEDRQDVKQKLSSLMLEMGIDITWDMTQGKYVFELRRGDTVVAEIPERTMHGPLVSRVRKLEAANARTYAFTYVVAAENYSVRSVEADDNGNLALAERAGAAVDSLVTPRDMEAGQIIAARRSIEEQSNLALTSFDLKSDAMTLRSNDVIDVSAITGDTEPYRISSVEFQPKSKRVRVNCYPEALSTAGNPVVQGPSTLGDPQSTLGGDTAGVVFRTDQGVLSLRIPSDARALYGVVLGSDDGVSYWTTGVVPGNGGGQFVGESGTSILFKAPVPEFTRSIPAADSADPGSQVLMAATSLGEMFTIGSIVDLGEGLFRIDNAVRPSPITLTTLNYVFVWRSGQVPYFSEGIPTTATRKFKNIAATPGQIAPVPVGTLSEYDVRTPQPDVPAGGTEGQLLIKQSADDYDVTWEDADGGSA